MIYTHNHRPAHVHAVSPDRRAKLLLNCPGGPLVAQRRAMMQAWADYLDKLKAGADVVKMRA